MDIPGTLLVVPLLAAAVVVAGCADPAADAKADATLAACGRFDAAVRAAALIEGVTVPELVKEQARSAAAEAEYAAQSVDGLDQTLAERMRSTAESLAALADEVGAAQLNAHAGPLPDLTTAKRWVQADVDAVARACADAGVPLVLNSRLGW